MSGIGLILLILAAIAIFGMIYFAVWWLCAVQRNHKDVLHNLEEVVDEGHHILDEVEDELHDEELNSRLALEPVSLNGVLLPAEILEKVFFLLPPKDTKSMVQVCRWWREVGEVPRLWTWACFKVDCHLYSAQKLQEMFASRRIHSVKRMRVRSHWIRVRSNEVAILEVLLPAVARRPELLESLDFGRPGDGYINLSEVDANVLAQAVTHLVEVSFSNCSQLTTQQMDVIFAALLDTSSHLKRLNMYFVNFSVWTNGWLWLGRVINKLEEVDLTGAGMTSKQTTAVFTLMIQNSNLKKLNLDIGTEGPFRPYWNIRTEGGGPINGVNPELLAEALTHLEEVKLPTRLNLKQKKAIFATLNASHGRLKRLDISGKGGNVLNDNNLSDVDAALIANVVNKMEFVDIRYTNLTVSQITAILKQSLATTSLKKLLIVGNDTRKFRRQTKRMEKLLAQALQVIPITDFREPDH